MKKPEKKEGNKQLALPDSFCWNEQCADYGRLDTGNLRKFGFTRKGRQRWQCKTCGSVVAATRGTVFHGKRHDEKTILECLAMLCERNSLADIGRVKGLKDETVAAWLKQVAPQMQQLEAILLRDYKMSRAQLDALWTYVGHKGEKGGVRKSPSVAPSGAGRPSIARRDYVSDAPSLRAKKKLHKA